jgi:hypothetical protein
MQMAASQSGQAQQARRPSSAIQDAPLKSTSLVSTVPAVRTGAVWWVQYPR